jgi:anti-anti-sigma regulatory factor
MDANHLIIEVPKRHWDDCAADMRSTLQTWEWREPSKHTERVTLNFTRVEFMEPWAVAMFASYVLYLRNTRKLMVEGNFDSGNPANQYLRQMGFPELLAAGTTKQVTEQWKLSEKNTGLHVIRTHQDVQSFAESTGMLGRGPTDETMDALKYGMSELGRNVVQHAVAEGTGVAIAQFFPKAKRIQIAVSDHGIGVRSSLGAAYPEIKTDDEAVRLAVLPHVSGASRGGMYAASDNAGLGLFFCEEIAWRAGGSIWIVSGNALLGVRRSKSLGPDRIHRRVSPTHGTTVVMDVPASGVEDFSNLLELCRILAADARRSPGEAGLDFADALPEAADVKIVTVREFNENIDRAREVRETVLIPAVKGSEVVAIDFSHVRFVTQSFAHALLNDALKLPGSLLRLTFVGCTRSTREVIRAVAAYAATYRQNR